MSRIAQKIAYPTFLQKYEEEILSCNGAYDLLDKYKDLAIDLAKVQFGWENYSINAITEYPDRSGIKKFLVYPDSFYAVLCWAGGDWEYPVDFLIYLDPKNKWRGYIPKKGNSWNYNTKKALGNDDTEDVVFLKQLFKDHCLIEDEEWFDVHSWGEVMCNQHAFLQDISKRFEVQ